METECRLRDSGGNDVHVALSSTVVPDAELGRMTMVNVVDISDRRRYLDRCQRHGESGALLLLDLDNFKQVNDTLGHPVGDRVIADIADVLSARMRVTDVLARLGGDEFAVVLPHCDLDEAEEIADSIADSIRLHVLPGEAAPPITASIGIATFGPSSNDYDAVLSAADDAMYEAKRAGRDSVRVAGTAVAVAGKANPGRAST